MPADMRQNSLALRKRWRPVLCERHPMRHMYAHAPPIAEGHLLCIVIVSKPPSKQESALSRSRPDVDVVNYLDCAEVNSGFAAYRIIAVTFTTTACTS